METIFSAGKDRRVTGSRRLLSDVLYVSFSFFILLLPRAQTLIFMEIQQLKDQNTEGRSTCRHVVLTGRLAKKVVMSMPNFWRFPGTQTVLYVWSNDAVETKMAEPFSTSRYGDQYQWSLFYRLSSSRPPFTMPRHGVDYDT